MDFSNSAAPRTAELAWVVINQRRGLFGSGPLAKKDVGVFSTEFSFSSMATRQLRLYRRRLADMPVRSRLTIFDAAMMSALMKPIMRFFLVMTRADVPACLHASQGEQRVADRTLVRHWKTQLGSGGGSRLQTQLAPGNWRCGICLRG